jgi:hypothetical protein
VTAVVERIVIPDWTGRGDGLGQEWGIPAIFTECNFLLTHIFANCFIRPTGHTFESQKYPNARHPRLTRGSLGGRDTHRKACGRQPSRDHHVPAGLQRR